jgi:hypothetical protein
MAIQEKKLVDLFKADEFSILELYQILLGALKKTKKVILIASVILSIFLILDYNFAPIEYESKAAVIIDQTTTTNVNSNLNSLLGLPTDNNGLSTNGTLSSDMYQDLFKSQVFFNELIQIKFPISQNSKDSITLEQYFYNGEKLSFYKKLKHPSSFFKQNNIVTSNLILKNQIQDNVSIVTNNLTPDLIISNQIPPIVQIDNNKAAVIGIMKSRIKLEIKDRNLTVLTKMPNSFQSAIVGKIALENLLKFITAFKTHKQISQISYLQERVIESEERYKIAQKRFAGYKDNSLGIIIQSAQTNEQVLNNELSVAFNIYNQFSVQLEQAKIELKKETPYFSILEPISIPVISSEPQFATLLLKYLSVFFAVTIILIIYKIVIGNNV